MRFRFVLASTAIICVFVIAPCAAQESTSAAQEAQRYNDMGRFYAQDAHFETALKFFTLAIAKAPSESQWALLNNSANVHLLLEEHQKALELYEEALADEAASGEVHLNVGLLYMTIGRTDQSYSHFQKGAELLGGMDEVQRLMGLTGGDAPLDGPRGDAAGGVSVAQIRAALEQSSSGGPMDRSTVDRTSLRGFRGAHLKPYRLLWLDVAG